MQITVTQDAFMASLGLPKMQRVGRDLLITTYGLEKSDLGKNRFDTIASIQAGEYSTLIG